MDNDDDPLKRLQELLAQLYGDRPMWYTLRGKEAVPCDDDNPPLHFFENLASRRVAQTLFKEVSIEVSTVFLGLDHNHFRNGPPVLFETMIFADAEEDFDQVMSRYSTWDEAELGHWAVVDMVTMILKERSEAWMAQHGVSAKAQATEVMKALQERGRDKFMALILERKGRLLQ